jgi:hypothetical protein
MLRLSTLLLPAGLQRLSEIETLPTVSKHEKRRKTLKIR